MKAIYVLVLVLLFTPSLNAEEEAAPAANIDIQTLRNSKVIGNLGVPLGTCVRIKATITYGGPSKADQGDYFLSISQVDDRKLPNPLKTRFYVHPQANRSVKLANDNFDLHKLRTGKRARSLDSEQIAKLQEGYVGKEVRLLLFETGQFSGIPNNLPKDSFAWQDWGFHFVSYVGVLDQYDDDAEGDIRFQKQGAPAEKDNSF